MKRQRVVVTGVGLATPLGHSYAELGKAIRSGQSAGKRISLFDASPFESQIASEVTDFKLDELVDLSRWPQIPLGDRKTELGLVAAKRCVESAGFKTLPTDTGVAVGTGLSSLTYGELEQDWLPYLKNGRSLNEKSFGENHIKSGTEAPWRHMTDELPRLIAGRYALRGPTLSSFAACAASNHSIGYAFQMIRANGASRFIAGGADSMIHPLGMLSFVQLGALTTRNDSPERASRPFDKTRDGFLLGEGGVFIMLESLSEAQARGAFIFGEIIGFGSSTDAAAVTAPHPEGEGAMLAMKRAMNDCGITPREVDYINAHGTSTPLNDKTETLAIRRVCGELAENIPVSSTKSMHGHLIAAAGAIESVACLFAINNSFLPPTINFEHADPECDLDYVCNQAREAQLDIVLNNSFGFGGQNGCLVYKKYNP